MTQVDPVRPGRPQPVVRPPATAAIFLVLTVREGGEQAVLDLLADVAGLTRSVDFRAPDGGLTCVVGVGAQVWSRLYDAPPPRHLHPFRPVVGAVHSAPSTPGDLLFHVRARRADLCFELAQLLVARLRGHAEVADEVHGFRYFDDRDLLGFVDGSENPRDQDAFEAVHIGAEDPAHVNGSYVVVQPYTHDLDAWNALTVESEEAAVGRHKLSNVELADDVKASNSHVELNSVTGPDGRDLAILRENMPFGRVGTAEFGTYFIGYAADPAVIETMLTRMFVGHPPGNHDRILDFPPRSLARCTSSPPRTSCSSHRPGRRADPLAVLLRARGRRRWRSELVDACCVHDAVRSYGERPDPTRMHPGTQHRVHV
ncbi:MAG: Dyp-type peroxidase, partial [Nocardioides sp.]|uniref:Dyp-type peroxidase n=1 Tax=Nocardioides sp. TaxID=35761 RepID=UPI003F03B431